VQEVSALHVQNRHRFDSGVDGLRLHYVTLVLLCRSTGVTRPACTQRIGLALAGPQCSREGAEVGVGAPDPGCAGYGAKPGAQRR
jgi:hypothetical protein